MKKFFLVLLVVVLLIILGGVLYIGYLGFIPGLSSLFGSDKPRDLGVKFTTEDYQKTIEKTGLQVLTETKTSEAMAPKDTMVLAGSHEVKTSFSGVDLTALITSHQDNWIYYPVSDVQVQIDNDGVTQISGMLKVDRLAGYAEATGANSGAIEAVKSKFNLLPSSIPFYISAKASATNGIASVNFSEVELGRMDVPKSLIDDHQADISNFFTQQINAFPGFACKSVIFTNGNLEFDGTVSDSIKTYK